MISDSIIKKEFIARTLKTGTDKIYSLQAEVAKEVFSPKTGRLFANLEAKNFDISNRSEHFTVTVSILKYMRFQEIRSNIALRTKLRLYNRIVWGVLYGETLPELKYGLTDEIREKIRKQLEAAGLQLTNDFGE